MAEAAIRHPEIMEILAKLTTSAITPEEAYDRLFERRETAERLLLNIAVTGSRHQDVNLSVPLDFVRYLRRILPESIMLKADARGDIINRIFDMAESGRSGQILEIAEGEERIVISLQKA